MARSRSKGPSTDAARDRLSWAQAVYFQWRHSRSLPSITDGISITYDSEHPLITKLANLAHVPAAGIAGLREGILWELHAQWLYQYERKTRRTAAGVSKTDAIVKLRRAEKFSRELLATISNLNPLASFAFMYVAQQRQFPKIEELSDSMWFKTADELAQLSSEAVVFLQGVNRRHNSQGRPRGGAFSISSRSLVEFVFRLLLDVRAAGGRLTLDKNTGGGTLVKALDLLRPHLPPGLIPKKPPLSTLARIAALDQKLTLR
jgi:hypothetical protein